ncbi:MAG TPA: hypothetical protein VGA10_10525 [Thermoanaerobaculia bacterium]
MLPSAIPYDEEVRIRAHRPAQPVVGRLDEPAWANAAAVTLVQQSPHPGSATPYSTTMRVIATWIDG